MCVMENSHGDGTTGGHGFDRQTGKREGGRAVQDRCWLLVGMQYELQDQVALINSVAAEVQQQTGELAEKGGVTSLSVSGRLAGD